jgi:hypothetical protein
MKDEFAGSETTDALQFNEAAPTALPDINAETYPFDTVQHLLDEAAYLNLFSVPDSRQTNPAIRDGSNEGIIGLGIVEKLHRFEISLRPPSPETGVRASNTIGEMLGRFEHRWMIIPDEFDALPGREPPPTLFNSARSQRFVMLDSRCVFDNGDGFRGFGTGTTYPASATGEHKLLAAAVGSILEGFGKFKGHEGTYTYCGSLSEFGGFTGSLLCRIMDAEGDLRTETSLPAFELWPNPEPDITYLMLRGQKQDKNQKTTYIFGPDGQVTGLNVNQQLRQVHIDTASRGRSGLRSVLDVGPVIGKMHADITFDFLHPGTPGTALSPIPFKSYNEYSLSDSNGRSVGSIVADGKEGRTFALKLAGAPAQAALRFGGFGPIISATGHFQNVEGLMTDNSVVGISPHALATLYVLRLYDPKAKYRTPFRESVDRKRREREKLLDAWR